MVQDMIYNDVAKKVIAIENSNIYTEIGYGNGLQINAFINKAMGSQGVMSQISKELFYLNIEGTEHRSSCFDAIDVSEARDKTEEMVSILIQEQAAGLLSKVCILGRLDNTISLIIQLAVERENRCPREVYFHSPFLANFMSESDNEIEFCFPSNIRPKSDGSSIIQMHNDFPLPMGVFEKSSGKGFCVQFPLIGNGLLYMWDQNRNHDLNKIKTLEELKNHKILLRPDHILSDIVEFKFTAVNNGWVECFNSWRQDLREKYVLDQYEREDLKWYKETYLHHFTYIYGKEAFNYETNEVDVKRLIDQGNDFGGYDAILIWHQYPRLGVDERNQWDFFNDFPQGRAGIKKIVDDAHKLGVKVFLPFKPWDVGYKESPYSATGSIAELIRDTDIDGIFFDTMNSVPKGFRDAIDNIKPGVAFCTEGQPHNKLNIEMITGSWDQYWNSVPMPEVNLLRYVLPEHFSPIISRWHVGEKKDMLIKRAIFNGTGIVIWQDIFGSWLPYNEDQKAKIRRWKQILQANREIFFCPNPVPLYPTLIEGLYCNCFESQNHDSVIYTLYNDTDRMLSGELFVHYGHEKETVSELWNNSRVDMINNTDCNMICSKVEAKDLIIIKLTKQGVVG